MPPPLLATNAPILNISHPREIGIFSVFWGELDAAVLYRLNSRIGKGLNFHIPLVTKIRLNDNARFLTPWYSHHMIFYFIEQSKAVQVRCYAFARFISVQPLIGLRHFSVKGGVVIE